MEVTEYTIYKYDGEEYLRFESHERNFLGIKKKVMRFIPTRTMFDGEGKRIKKWTIKKFPTEVNRYNKYRCIYGSRNVKDSFMDRYPDIILYLHDLNSNALMY